MKVFGSWDIAKLILIKVVLIQVSVRVMVSVLLNAQDFNFILLCAKWLLFSARLWQSFRIESAVDNRSFAIHELWCRVVPASPLSQLTFSKELRGDWSSVSWETMFELVSWGWNPDAVSGGHDSSFGSWYEMCCVNPTSGCFLSRDHL